MTFINRLEGVRQVGQGQWVAKCPSHEDRSPSLSIKETGDGTILLHCFAGCSAHDVVISVGLNLSDLFPQPLTPNTKPYKMRPNYKGMWLLAMQAFYVIFVATEDVALGRTISESDLVSVRKARARIGEVMEVLGDE